MSYMDELEAILKQDSFAAMQSYRDGMDIFEKNFKAAFDLFSRSADLGYPPAIYMVGKAYIYGHGVDENIPLGLATLESAYQMGHARAAYIIAVYHYKWERLNESFSYALKAAEGGDQDAQKFISNCYKTAQGTPANAAKAKEWRDRARAIDRRLQAPAKPTTAEFPAVA